MNLNSTSTLRLIWPQWQGAGTSSVKELYPELPLEEAHRSYMLGTTVLQAILPEHTGPTRAVPVHTDNYGLEQKDGIEAKQVVTEQLAEALEILRAENPSRVLTLGGECSVSVAPFSYLAQKYGNDLALIWIDSHPDIGTGASKYPGYHAMAVSLLTGHGDRDILKQLPATIAPSHTAIAGLHEWTEDDYPNLVAWGISSFSPEDLATDSAPLTNWLKKTGCSHAAVHFDVDTVDSTEEIFGLGKVPDGLSSQQVKRLVTDISATADVVGLTVAEFIPRQVLALKKLLADMPLI